MGTNHITVCSSDNTNPILTLTLNTSLNLNLTNILYLVSQNYNFSLRLPARGIPSFQADVLTLPADGSLSMTLF